MESFKHSCPFCGQHIEYTVGYCGKQMPCPICGQTVTFPAIPPGGAGPGLRAQGSKRKSATAWKVKAPKALSFLGNFQHWNVVGQCAVPFLIIAVLLGGAIVVKNKLGQPSSDNVAAPAVQADPDAWKKMTDMTKAAQAVEAAGRVLQQAKAGLAYEQAANSHVNNSDPLQKKGAEDRLARAQNMVGAAAKQFNNLLIKYQELGGTIDYRSQFKAF
ncbi:MAG TPA: hypothetical protein VGO59_19665 [Verrucomicrobiae bacterium]|jgi:hypothetical protein